MTNDDYTRPLSTLLPPDPVWSANDPAIAGVAPSSTHVHQCVDALMRELDPRTTTELINRWERPYGLPDECIPAGTQTLRQRQQWLDAKANLAGGINEDFYLAQLAALGRPDATITRYDKSTFTCSSACTDTVSVSGWRYHWQVDMPATTNSAQMICGDPCDSALHIWGDIVIECVLNKLCPSHTYIILKYPKQSVYRTGTKTTQKDKFGAGKNGFTRDNPQTGTPATDLDDDYSDMLQEGLYSAVEASGASLEEGRHGQLLIVLCALLSSRKNSFSNIKSDGIMQTALENLGLGEGAKLNTATATSGRTGFIATPVMTSGIEQSVIIQWGWNATKASASGGDGNTIVFPVALNNACVVAAANYDNVNAPINAVATGGYITILFLSRCVA